MCNELDLHLVPNQDFLPRFLLASRLQPLSSVRPAPNLAQSTLHLSPPTPAFNLPVLTNQMAEVRRGAEACQRGTNKGQNSAITLSAVGISESLV
ncbi:hypothetical protein RRG08_028421 [Elysia crispata]|uniref:Uncharacterized protein n=1 Tax=Elysia crispata TaxID=231223 RepID=A0AAE1A2P8_9GAST|nr:hypothetical protein RRG08_028421 [Elysia crispata]